MVVHYTDDHLTVHIGDCRQVLATLPAESVHCVVTSPPYWGLRDYGTGGQLGLEPTPEAYVANMVAVFREVRRVLRKDGTCWVNMGDGYSQASTHGGDNKAGPLDSKASLKAFKGLNRVFSDGLKPKDLIGMPWRLAFALQADGWVLRSEIVWSKPNPMPESVTDRPTKSHEQVFLFSKAKRIGPDPTPFDDISDSDARWLAALIDTEGSIVIRREEPKGTDYGGHAAQVSIGNTSRVLLDEVARIAGSGNVLERPGQNAPMWYWQASNKVALGLLRRMYPFLIVKQRQARCAIALEEGKRYPGGHAPLPKAEVNRRERIWQAVKSLNHFGAPDLTGIPEPIFGRWTSQPYYYDADAVREAPADYKRKGGSAEWTADSGHTNGVGSSSFHQMSEAGRNLRSVWTIATEPYPGAHFATFPQKLVEPCIKAGTSERGVCPECGAPWVREVERTSTYATSHDWRDRWPPTTAGHNTVQHGGITTTATTVGWRPSCVHDADALAHKEGWTPGTPMADGRWPEMDVLRSEMATVPATVLDPFAGSGTTGLVANRLGRRAILIDLSADYIDQAMLRNQQAPLGIGA